MKSSVFKQAIHHAYAQTDGTYAWPNSREGDMLREAKTELEIAEAKIAVTLRALALACLYVLPASVKQFDPHYDMEKINNDPKLLCEYFISKAAE